MNILMEALLRYRKTFSLLTFTWIFLCFFLIFNKRILLLILLTQTRQFRDLFVVVEVLYSPKTSYLRGKASQLIVLSFNNSLITYLVSLKCGSARELVISVTLNSVDKPQPTSVPCVNWWTWRERTAPCKPTAEQFAEKYIVIIIIR